MDPGALLEGNIRALPEVEKPYGEVSPSAAAFWMIVCPTLGDLEEQASQDEYWAGLPLVSSVHLYHQLEQCRLVDRTITILKEVRFEKTISIVLENKVFGLGHIYSVFIFQDTIGREVKLLFPVGAMSTVGLSQ